MVDDIARRYGRTPDRLLVDTSYATSERHRRARRSRRRVRSSVYTPPPTEKENVKPATLARRVRKRAKEPLCLKAWRERMASEAGKTVYALRKRIERINADRKNHGFGFLAVRGLIKAKAHALWHALANNLARRSPSEDRNPMRRSTRPNTLLPFATRTAFTPGRATGT